MNTANGTYSQRFCDQRHEDLEKNIDARFLNTDKRLKGMEEDVKETNDNIRSLNRMLYYLLTGIVVELIGIIGILLKVS